MAGSDICSNRWRSAHRCLSALSLPAALLASAVALHAGAASAGTQASYYVDPVNGNDTNSGKTTTAAFRSILKAQRTVRALGSSWTGDIVVYLRGGTHTLYGTLEFTPLDSGKSGYKAIYRAYPGETPILSGGKAIAGWQLHDTQKNIYRASVGANDNFRQLYVNGTRARRAWGHLPATEQQDWGYTTSDTSLWSWNEPEDLEFVYDFNVTPGRAVNWLWVYPRFRVQALGWYYGALAIVMQDPPWTPYWEYLKKDPDFPVPRRRPDTIENAYELLDSAGEWYLDNEAHTLYYIPQPGESLSTATVIAPVLEKLVEVRGALNNRVQWLQFDGLTFSYATNLAANQYGHPDVFANNTMSVPPPGLTSEEQLLYMANPFTIVYQNVLDMANVQVEAAQNVSFTRCTFSHLGGAGLDLIYAQNSTVSGSTFSDISGSGIQIAGHQYEPALDNPDKTSKNLYIYNNQIHDVAVEYRGGVGVYVGYAENAVIAHNELHHLPYTGISMGWAWGASNFSYNSISRDNKILYNKIHHYMQLLGDGSCIYTLGDQPNTVIQGNYCRRPYTSSEPAAFYIDNGSAHLTLLDNVAEHVTDEPDPPCPNPTPPTYLAVNVLAHDIYVNRLFSNTPNQDPALWTPEAAFLGQITAGPFGAEAQAIIANAGVSASYVPDTTTLPNGWRFYNENNTGTKIEGEYEVDPADFSRFNYVGTWYTEYAAPFSGGTIKYSAGKNDYATFKFYGTQVKLYTTKSFNYGYAAVSIDNGTETYVNLYSSTMRFDQLVWSKTVSAGDHTVKIRVPRIKDRRSSDYWVPIDGVQAYDLVGYGPTNYYNDDVAGSPFRNHQIYYSGSWGRENDFLSRGTCSMSFTANDTASFRFVGTQVKWYAPLGPNYGSADVWVDSGSATRVNLKNSTFLNSRAVWTSPVQSHGLHTVNIKVVGGSVPTDNWVLLDGFEVVNPGYQAAMAINDTVKGTGTHQFNYHGPGWYTESNSGCTGGTITYSSYPGDSVTLSFIGTQIRWYATGGSNYGVGAVSVDDEPESFVDPYSPTLIYNQLLWSSRVLPYGPHTLTIRVTGTRNPRSSDNFVLVDGVEVVP
ncbi:MAG: right-handed parallel beta-helix repeat-containing protein [Polyangiaceae bacterium]|nr:right-handed parallel beta-helix repeat-containing protein [Polyangiaceae bacterium]